MARLGVERFQTRFYRLALQGTALGLYLLFAYRDAWLSDDAMISLRTASNVLHGYGLRWNVEDRVQTFTHPLWLFLLIGAHALSGEPFYSSLYLSWVVSGAAVFALLFTRPAGTLGKLTALTILALSHAFMDFSSSGLENPLTHLFLIAFVVVLSAPTASPARTTAACWIAASAALNRLDTILLFAPALCIELYRTRSRSSFAKYMLAFVPLGAWEAFSIVYYGFPFPNTAYAKLSQAQVATPLADGLNYLLGSLLTDPLTLCAIAICFIAAIAQRDTKRTWLMAGAALYLAYILRIGGDFMTGRFLSAPLCLCVACLATSDWLSTRGAAITVASTLALGWFGGASSMSKHMGGAAQSIEHYIDRFGIHDERGLFFSINSLTHAASINPLMRTHTWSAAGFEMREETRQSGRKLVRVVDAIGHAGYFAGPQVHLVDHWALSDALIARLPAAFGKYGHFPRVIPDGYIGTLTTGQNQIVDPDLAEYYRKLSLIVSGPLWDLERLKTIWKFNMGAYEPLRERYSYYRGREFNVRLWFTNPGTHRCVSTYVWNDFRATAYELDCASSPGKSYEIVWKITASGATLVSPSGLSRSSSFAGLRTSGLFTVSFSLTDAPKEPMKELHELRYTYARSCEELDVQRHPWPVWVQDFPLGRWYDGRAPGVLQVEDAR